MATSWQPGGGGQRVHLGDDRLRDRLHGVHHLGADLEQVPGVVERWRPAMSPKLWPAENTGPLAASTTPERVARTDLPERLR